MSNSVSNFEIGELTNLKDYPEIIGKELWEFLNEQEGVANGVLEVAEVDIETGSITFASLGEK